MGRFDRLPGIDEGHTTRRNVLIGSGYVFGGFLVLGATAGDPEDNNDDLDRVADDDEPDNEPTGVEDSVDDLDGVTEDDESDDDPTGVELLAGETYSNAGSITAVAPGGDHVAFGLHTVDRFIGYDVETDSFTTVDGGVGEPSQMELRDDGYATVAWWEADTLGGIDTAEGDSPGWTVEFEGLAGVDAVADHSAVAAIADRFTHSEGGPGRVGIVSEGGEWVWDESLGDAEPSSVAVTDEGEHVVVGTVEFWDDEAEEYRGSVGVRLLDGGTGDERWRYETDDEPIRVAVHEAQELVVVGTLDNELHVLNFDGDELWEADGHAGLDVLSDDGSTVIVLEGGEIDAYNAIDGDQRWRTEADLGSLGFVSINSDGSRVAVTNRSQDERRLHIINDGKSVWTDVRHNHVSMDLSADGATWSVIEFDGDANEAHVEVYRDHDA